MGAGASAPRRPSEQWTAEDCAAVLRNMPLSSPEIAERVTRRRMSGSMLLALSVEEIAEALGAEGSDARMILEELSKHRQLTSEEKSLVDGMDRRSSAIAEQAQERVRDADRAQQPKVLATVMQEEASKGSDGDPAFACWSLSCVAELCQGNADLRTALHSHGACDLIMQLMEQFCDDIYVQWQGCQAMGCLAALEDAALDFGERGMVSLMRCLCRTDVGELGSTGIRAFSVLIEQCSENMSIAVENDAATIIESLLDEWPHFLQFQFSGRRLLDLLQQQAEGGNRDRRGEGESESKWDGDGGESKAS